MPEALFSAFSAFFDVPSQISVPGFETISEFHSDVVVENLRVKTQKVIVVRDTGSDLSIELHHNADLIEGRSC